MKKIAILIISISMFAVFLTSCIDTSSSGSPSSSNSSQKNNNKDIDAMSGDGKVHAEEIDGATIERKAVDVSQFYGTWTGTSEKAAQLYGNVDIRVNSDGTWEGNITEESISGKWVQANEGIHLNSEIFSFDLAFNDANKLIMIETGGGEELYTVLSKKN